jgi:hypothetical protein
MSDQFRPEPPPEDSEPSSLTGVAPIRRNPAEKEPVYKPQRRNTCFTCFTRFG